jgi:hypothetical protein
MTQTDRCPPAAGPGGTRGEISTGQETESRCDATARDRQSAQLQGVVELWADQLDRLDGHMGGHAIPDGIAVRVRLPRDRAYRYPELAVVERIAWLCYGRHAQIVGPDGPAVAQVLYEVRQRHEQWQLADARLAEAQRQAQAEADAELWGEIA